MWKAEVPESLSAYTCDGAIITSIAMRVIVLILGIWKCWIRARRFLEGHNRHVVSR